MSELSEYILEKLIKFLSTIFDIFIKFHNHNPLSVLILYHSV